MKENRMRKILSGGGFVLGAGLLTASPQVVEVMGDAGLDFIMVDLEHGGFSPYDTSRMEELARAAELFGIALMVRVPANDEGMIGKVLDTGVQNVLVPNVSDQSSLTALLRATHFGLPGGSGSRSAPVSRASRWRAPKLELFQEANREVMIGIMLEDKHVIDNLGLEMSLKGVDFAFLGLADLSLSLGFPGMTDHPEVLKYKERVLGYCTKNNIPLAAVASDAKDAEKALKEGFKIVRIGLDLGIVYNSLSKSVNEIRSTKQ